MPALAGPRWIGLTKTTANDRLACTGEGSHSNLWPSIILLLLPPLAPPPLDYFAATVGTSKSRPLDPKEDEICLHFNRWGCFMSSCKFLHVCRFDLSRTQSSNIQQKLSALMPRFIPERTSAASLDLNSRRLNPSWHSNWQYAWCYQHPAG